MTAVFAWVVSGFVTWLPWWVRVLVLLAVGLMLLIRQAGLVTLRLPQNARQVPQSVYLRHPVLANLQFGFEMGTGMRTLVTAVAPYLLLALMLLFPPAQLFTAVAVGAVFGMTRGIVPVLWKITADSPGTRHWWDDRFADTRVLIGWLSLVVCCVGATLIVLPL